MSEERFEKFLDAQIKILRDSSQQIQENAIAYHKETCENPLPGCDQTFLKIFQVVLGDKLFGLQQAEAYKHTYMNPN
jgi:hypothetical protein